MKLEVIYLASVRETMKRSREQVPWTFEIATVADLIQLLAEQDAAFKALYESENPPLVAVNQIIADGEYPLDGGDEVAFFPEMTGG